MARTFHSVRTPAAYSGISQSWSCAEIPSDFILTGFLIRLLSTHVGVCAAAVHLIKLDCFTGISLHFYYAFLSTRRFVFHEFACLTSCCLHAPQPTENVTDTHTQIYVGQVGCRYTQPGIETYFSAWLTFVLVESTQLAAHSISQVGSNYRLTTAKKILFFLCESLLIELTSSRRRLSC